jgi:hypothetical protein
MRDGQAETARSTPVPEEESMAGLAETVTGRATLLSVAVLERALGVVARAVTRVDEMNVGLAQRNALQAVTANRAWRREWDEL